MKIFYDDGEAVQEVKAFLCCDVTVAHQARPHVQILVKVTHEGVIISMVGDVTDDEYAECHLLFSDALDRECCLDDAEAQEGEEIEMQKKLDQEFQE